ncbi:adaptor protein MecA [Bacillus sp. FJAT-42376]|uniref:adaptor protein MecA n=1 Tax=Bacillus sp. FJAT-42376 TaxID=2014076 RepID=UPI000F4F4997|nr:adaptor protein MecA [Bacillus sp. FJAT-42376]AZB42372.1 adaptor protein MecA [Bacillus sp. FJAT-42376]
MEIERINEHTVKFYISYGDIEDRGFDRDEIWYNRERSEELFWEMMDEVHEEEDFMMEGPLWIQVQAMDKGLEVVVTRAQMSKDGQKLELPISDDKYHEIPVDENIDSLMDEHFSKGQSDSEEQPPQLEYVIHFGDFEDLISLSKTNVSGFTNRLFALNSHYYLYVEFTEEQAAEEMDNVLSIISEYGSQSKVTVHRLEEYGKKVMDEHALHTIRKHFQ